MFSVFHSLFPSNTQDIIVFSESSWIDLSHFSRYLFRTFSNQGNILFIETLFASQLLNNEKVAITYPEKNITILQYQVRIEQISKTLPLFIAKQLRKLKMKDPILWFYSPVCSEIIQYLNHSIVIFDHTHNNSKDRLNQNRFLSLADIVITEDSFPPEKNSISAKLWSDSSSKIDNSIKQALKRKKEKSVEFMRLSQARY